MPNAKSQMGPKTGKWVAVQNSRQSSYEVLEPHLGYCNVIAEHLSKEHATFIVKACNHFEEMRTAIKNLAVCMENEPEGFHPAWIAQIKRLIAKIEGA